MLAELIFWTPGASTTAQQVDWLLLFLVLVCGSVGLLVAVLLFYFCIRYRRGRVPKELPPTKKPLLLEWGWTLAPLGPFAVMYVWGAHVYLTAYTPPPDATPTYVVAKQWMWKFQHPEGQREINTLHVPVGQPVKLLIISEDVIHSFFVPAFRIHMDALPGRYTSVWFQATQEGTYHLFCSQYCGTDHAGMTGQVIAMKPADYQKWLNYESDGSLALRGRQVFLKYRCLSCHSANAHARAPVLEGLFGKSVPLKDGRVVKADDGYIRRSILKPSDQIVAGFDDVMPPFEGQITEEEIIAASAYIQSLEPGGTPSRVEDYPPPTKTPAIKSEDIDNAK